MRSVAALADPDPSPTHPIHMRMRIPCVDFLNPNPNPIRFRSMRCTHSIRTAAIRTAALLNRVALHTSHRIQMLG